MGANSRIEWTKLETILELLSEAAVEISNAYGPGNIVVQRLRQRIAELEDAPEVSDSDHMEWLAARRSIIGASESPAILGCGYSSENALTVWLRKTGIDEEQSDGEHLAWGHLLQPIILAEFGRRLGLTVLDLGDFTIQRHPSLPWLGCTLDGLIEDSPEGRAVVEAKNVSQFNAGDWRDDEPPLRVNVQVQHQMEVCGANAAYVVGLIGGNRLAWKLVRRNQRFIDAMLPRLEAFWRLVEDRIPPPIDGSEASTKALRMIYPRDDGETIELGAKFCEHFEELSQIKAEEHVLSNRRAFLENEIKAALGDAAEAVLPDGSRFTWRTIERAEYTVPASSYRVLRQHAAKLERVTRS